MRIIISLIVIGLVLLAWLVHDNQKIVASIEDSSLKFAPSSDITPDNITQEATQYIQQITDKDNIAIDIQEADDFISKDQTLSLGNLTEIENLSLNQLVESGLKSSSPITLIKDEQQIVYKTPSEILLNAKGNKETEIRYLEDNTLTETTIEKLLEKYPLDTVENIAVLETIEHYVITTPGELLKDDTIDKEATLKIIKKPYRVSTTSIGELLIGDETIADDDIFYVRNINNTDEAGIWGIIQDGLLENFAKGIAIRRGDNYEKYQIDIPQFADEKLANDNSSFLGKLIFNKSKKSYVYNFEKGKMGTNPDLIFPGQELVIVKFSSEELIEIYKHFITNSNS